MFAVTGCQTTALCTYSRTRDPPPHGDPLQSGLNALHHRASHGASGARADEQLGMADVALVEITHGS